MWIKDKTCGGKSDFKDLQTYGLLDSISGRTEGIDSMALWRQNIDHWSFSHTSVFAFASTTLPVDTIYGTNNPYYFFKTKIINFKLNGKSNSITNEIFTKEFKLLKMDLKSAEIWINDKVNPTVTHIS